MRLRIALTSGDGGGRVDVRPENVTGYRRLRGAERLPVGTTVDAREGRVRLTVASDDDGGTWTAVFYDGSFTVFQPAEGEPVTTLKLTGPSYRDACGSARAARRKPRRVRRLWGDAPDAGQEPAPESGSGRVVVAGGASYLARPGP